MTWEEFMAPLLVQFVMPLAVTLAGGAITYITVQVGGAAKKYLNTNIDSQLNALLHAAVDRSVEALMARYRLDGVAPAAVSRGPVVGDMVNEVITGLRQTNPDTLEWFKLDENRSKLEEIVRKTIAAKTVTQTIAVEPVS